MAVSTRGVRASTPTAETRRAVDPVGPPPATPPVKVWCSLGVVLLAVEAFIFVKWVTGPDMHAVPSGPDVPPEWMRVVFVVAQVALPLAALTSFTIFVVRPWRQGRGLTTDGMLWIAFLLASPYDMLSNYFNYGFTYNSYLVNVGSIVGSVPGVLAPHTATANDTFPAIVVPCAYVTSFMVASLFGCWVMRQARIRRPQLGTVSLIGICWVALMGFDFVLEGVLFMPLGFWAYGGDHLAIAPSHYFRYPVQEMVFSGLVFTAFASLRYFTNDRGETIAERGASQLRVSPRTRTVIRLVSVIAAIHLAWLVTYHLPQGLLALHGGTWPHDIQKRSYFTNGICGPHVGLRCPGPGVPNPRPGAPTLTLSGRLAAAR